MQTWTSSFVFQVKTSPLVCIFLPPLTFQEFPRLSLLTLGVCWVNTLRCVWAPFLLSSQGGSQSCRNEAYCVDTGSERRKTRVWHRRRRPTRKNWHEITTFVWWNVRNSTTEEGLTWHRWIRLVTTWTCCWENWAGYQASWKVSVECAQVYVLM